MSIHLPSVLNYKKIESFVKSERERIKFLICLALMFIVGFGTGRAGQTYSEKPTAQPYYNTKSSDKVEKPRPAAEVGTESTPTATTDSQTPCLIKGNVSGKNKIYHVPGGSFYKRVKPEQCFASESEARTAGFRKSSR